RRLAVGADERDVVHALGLELPHGCTSLDLYSLRCKPPNGTSSISVCTMSAARSCSRMARASSASPAPPAAISTATGSGGSCLGPGADGRTRMLPLTRGANVPTTSRIADG